MDFLNETNVAASEWMLVVLERLAAGQRVSNVRFHGTSMLPMLRQKQDTVELISPPAQFKKYDLPMYRSSNGKYVMHRVVAVKPDHYVCLGDNTYTFEKIAPEQMVALVCAFKRGKKRISVDSPGYLLYCRLWCMLIPLRRLCMRVLRLIWRKLKS